MLKRYFFITAILLVISALSWWSNLEPNREIASSSTPELEVEAIK